MGGSENEIQAEKILILFGTQTGNSEEVAERLCRKLCVLKKSCKAISLDEFNFTKIADNGGTVVFICSTTGQGEFPESARQFWKLLLRKNLPPDCLEFLRFCVIGLGDSSYEKYNIAAKKLSKRLLQLGAKELLSIALCDDQHELGYDAGFETWLKIFLSLITPNSSSLDLDRFDDILLPPKYRLCFIEPNLRSNNVFDKLGQNMAKFKSNERITATNHFQAVHLIKFEIDEGVSYQPGDVMMLTPQNDPDNIDEFLQLLDAPMDAEFTLEPTDPDYPVPRNLPVPCTLRNCVASYFDIQAIPRRLFFDILWHFSQSDLEQEKLREFTTAEGQEELYSYCNRPRRNIIEVLQDFPMTTPHIPLDYLFDLIPCIRSRFFSIASSLNYSPCELQLIIAQVTYKTRLAKPRMGLCSTWLSRLSADINIPFSLKCGSICLPANESPIIMVGPGTGVAPFRSFIQERISKQMKDNYLFFGCRFKDKDFLCSEEWTSFTKQKFLNLYVAFSRDQDEKVYVHHKMTEEAELLWDLIKNRNAYFYIAGNAKNMPLDVKNSLLNIIEKCGNMDAAASKHFLQKLENQKRFQVETWC